jgi:hypothetical protein
MTYLHYMKHLGTYVTRSCTMNIVELGWQPADLQHLDLNFHRRRD